MKILLVTPYFFEPHRWNISAYKTAHSLARIGVNVIVFTARSEGQPFLEKVGSHLKIYRYRDLFIPDPANFGIIPFFDYPDADVLIDLHYAGLRLTEVPVVMHPSQGGSSMHDGAMPLYYVFKMLLSMFLATLGRRPKSV